MKLETRHISSVVQPRRRHAHKHITRPGGGGTTDAG